MDLARKISNVLGARKQKITMNNPEKCSVNIPKLVPLQVLETEEHTKPGGVVDKSKPIQKQLPQGRTEEASAA